MKVACIGGGPGGLNCAIQIKRTHPTWDVSVHERGSRDSTYGWGIVLSDQTTEGLKAADPETYSRIAAQLVHWDDIDIHFMGRCIRSTGHGFSGMGRQVLLDTLNQRAQELGVQLRFDTPVDAERLAGGADLVVAADGIFSRTRERYADVFQPEIERRHCKFIWFGVEKAFEAFTFIFLEIPGGWIQAHAYRYNRNWSTFIVECDEQSWRNAGFDRMRHDQGVTHCRRLFAEFLDGKPLLENRRLENDSSNWMNFDRINNARWHHGNIVLLGDAAHTAHFSVGSGTKLAIEDGIALAQALKSESSIEDALQAYEETRRIDVLRIQNAARNSTEWFENVRLKSRLEPEQFAYSLLTRSQRVDHENLRLRDRPYLEGLEQWYYARSGGNSLNGHRAPPPMFAPYRLRGLDLVNRVVVSPMAMYSAREGLVDDFHLVHLGSRALGGAGLIFTEMTCVTPEGRITPGCAGLYRPDHGEAWKRIVDFIHRQSPAKVAIQLGHSGPKGSTKLGWEGMDEPLDEGNWPVLGPSPVPWSPANQVPVEMGEPDLERVTEAFVASARMAIEADFDLLELHCAHGYLLSSFITPLTNRRPDRYGGSLENRMRFPLQVFDALRAVWPEERPMSVRISATDWVAGGIGIDDAVEVARLFREHGVDIVDVSAGQTSVEARPVYGRMFQTPFSDRIRSELNVPTIAVGNVYDANHVNSILMAGRADLCALARPHLSDPSWAQHAAGELGYEELYWPRQYLAGKEQFHLLKRRERAIQEAS
ncbi:MAG: bifunctional salicylyl-CoA 5-hydroxylase/oxidoreductase [bacterium]